MSLGFCRFHRCVRRCDGWRRHRGVVRQWRELRRFTHWWRRKHGGFLDGWYYDGRLVGRRRFSSDRWRDDGRLAKHRRLEQRWILRNRRHGNGGHRKLLRTECSPRPHLL